jgi:NADH:ubiquinone oxidoreductase subunit F (NADH-binding)
MDFEVIASVQDNIIGNCLCVLGDSMAMPVGAMVRKFRGEFEQLAYTHGSEVDRIGAVVGSPEEIGAMP